MAIVVQYSCMNDRAGFIIRAVAYCLDNILFKLISIGILFGFDLFQPIIALSKSGLTEKQLIVSLMQQYGIKAYLGLGLSIFFYISYNSFELMLGASPMKLALGLKIFSTDSSTPPLSALFFRWLLKNLLQLNALIAIFVTTQPIVYFTLSITATVITFGYLLALGPERRTLHDRLTNTAVFRI